MSRTRNQSRQALWNTDSSPPPARRSRVDDDDSSGSSTTSIDQEEEEWSTKNDGGPIKQNHFGTKRGEGKVNENTGGDQRGDRRGKGRGRGSSRVRGKGSGRRGKREDVVVKRESSSPERQTRVKRTRTRSSSGPTDDPAPTNANKPHEATSVSNENNDTGHEAELEEEEEVTTRKSGRARRLPTRFAPDADRTDGPRRSTAKAVEGKERMRSEAVAQLKKARGGSSRRQREKSESKSESPDPIGLYGIDIDVADSDQFRQPPSTREENDQNQTKEVEDPIPEIPGHEGPTRKGVLKRRHDGESTTVPKKKKGVTIDETKNQVKQIRSIRLITSSTSTSISDRGREVRPPPIKRPRGPNRYGIRARKGQNDQVPVIPPRRRRTIHEDKKDLSALLATHLEQSEREKGVYEVSSDSDPDLKSGPSRSGTKRAKKARKGMNKVILNQQGNVVNDNKISLLAMAASLNSSDGDSSSIDDPDSHSSPNVSTLKPKSEARSSAHPPLATPTIDFTRHTTRPVPPIPARPMSILSPVRPRPPSRADELRARAEREIEQELRARAEREFEQQLRVRAERDFEHRLRSRPRTDLEQAELWSDFVGVMEYAWERTNRPRLDQVKVFRPPPSAIPQNQIQICRQSPKSPPVKGQSGPRPSAHLEEINEDPTHTGSPPRTPRKELLAGPPPSVVTHEILRPSLDFEKSCRRLAGIQLADRGMGMRVGLPLADRVGNVPRL